MLATTDGLTFIYDFTGVAGFKYNGNNYYYRKDILGNVITLLDDNGNIIAKYLYNAWGITRVLDNNGNVITDQTHIGQINPFRYRSYFYDKETGLYYLNARYYSPGLCRFISPDIPEYLDPSTPNGLNLYTYCNNNPIMYTDPSGHDIEGILTQFTISLFSYILLLDAARNNETIRKDMEAIGWNPFNANEDLVISSSRVSFYKGVPVFKIDGLDTSMSFGAIFLDKKHGTEILKHERGHNTQLMSMGILKYSLFIAIPSPLENGDNTPWELSASILGGSRYYSSKGTTIEKYHAMLYFYNASSLSPIMWLKNLYYFFR